MGRQDRAFNLSSRSESSRAKHIIVIEGSEIYGMITFRELVSAIAQGQNPNEVRVIDIAAPTITLKTSDFSSIFTVLHLFNQHSIQCLPVVDEEKNLVGIITTNNLLQVLQASSLMRWQPVARFVTTAMVYATPTSSILEVAQLMSAQNSGCVAILSANSSSASSGQNQLVEMLPVGIITEQDIVQLQTAHGNLNALPVGTVLSSPLIYLNHDDSVWNVYQAMQRLELSHLGVVGKQGDLIGIVGHSNLIEVFDVKAMYGFIEELQPQTNEFLVEKSDLNRAEPRIPESETNIQEYTERDYLLAIIALRLRQSLDLVEILETAVQEIRRWLQADRIFIYPFGSDWDGVVNFESVSAPQWSILGRNIRNGYYEEIKLSPNYNNNAVAIADIYADVLDSAYVQFLARLQVRSSLIIPIPRGETFWGLMIIHNCSTTRQWQTSEIDFLERFAVQLAINIHQSQLLERSQIELSERRQAEGRLLHNAFHDSLTDLPNRALFMDRLSHVIERSKRHPSQLFAVLFLDLDRFKVVNDSLGHMVGDLLLVAIAQRLQTYLHSSDTFARLGGDEFVILLEDIEDIGTAITLADRIQHELRQSFRIGGYEVFTSASIGIVVNHSRYEQPESILRDADTAMYRAKSRGKAQYVVFDTAMYDGAVSRLQSEMDLRRSLERNELQLHYQPIMSLVTKKITGFESLIRWQHPERGVVFPSDFIPIAEETGLIVPIGAWVLQEACRQMKQWQQQFPTDPMLVVSVNISAVQISHPDLIKHIEQALQSSGLEAGSLKLEITESTIMENMEIARNKLQILRSMGIQVYIDDFGTGYSSFKYLQNLPIDVLKIDSSFISRMVTDRNSLHIVQTIMALAHGIGMGVVAEGVETTEQLTCLEEMGNGSVQGYFISRPLNSESAEALIMQGLS
jgi:diguanylate cyclase (GGDEF)-like protein